ncbi:MAG: biotin transporter BioY [Coriobacteriales bacterium]|jgi:biotin transport system substrate-specific component|nr:biotin transporter BioY [Coriobacteriales bacterium]
MNESRTRSLVLCGLSIALLTAGAFIAVPFGPIVFSLQSLMLMFIVLILKPKEALAAVSGYLLLGAAGLPVGAGFRGGLSWLLGPTGGFLIGFLVGVALIAALRGLPFLRARSAHVWPLGQVMAFDGAQTLVIILVYYLFGTLWFVVSTGATVPAALMACVLPFIVPDLLKAAAALLAAQPVRAALGRSVVRPREQI